MVKVKDLKDQIGINEPPPFLYCLKCGAEYSANRADYFMARPERVFTCCKRKMVLVTKQVTYKEVK